jgi:hypothetical protein
MRTPTGIPEKHVIFRLWGDWLVLPWLTLSGGLEFHDVQNNEHVEGAQSFWVTSNIGIQLSLVEALKFFN